MEGRQGGPQLIYKFHNILVHIIRNQFKRLDYVSPPNLPTYRTLPFPGNKTYNSRGSEEIISPWCLLHHHSWHLIRKINKPTLILIPPHPANVYLLQSTHN